MKTRELYSIVLKIIGLISLWHFITIFIGILLSAVGVFNMLFSAGGMAPGGFLSASLIVMIFQLALALIISIFCLFRTNTLLKVLKLDDNSILELLSERKVLYHLIVLSFGVFLFAGGLKGFYSINVKTETISDMSQAMYTINNTPSIVSMKESRNYSFNYFALLELLIGIILLIKSKAVTKWVLIRIDSNLDDNK